MTPSLFPHQQRCLDWLSTRPRAIIALEQGLGKTAVAARDATFPALVIPPAHAKLTWRDEFATWRPEAKLQILKGPDDFFDQEADVWVTNYDVLRRTYLPRCATLIADENHYLTNPEAHRTKKLLAHAGVSPRVRLVGGTPMQRPINLWPLLQMVNGTRMTYIDFGKRYAAGFLDEFKRWDFRGASNLPELRTKLSRVMFRLLKKETLDLPSKLPPKVIALDLPLDQREREYDLAAIALTGNPTPFEGLSEILRLQADAKLPMAMSFIRDLLDSEPDQKIIVFAWHRETVKRLAAQFADDGVVTYNGDTPQRAKDRAAPLFQSPLHEAGSPRLFIGNIRAAGTVLTLTAASIVVFVEGSWNPNEIDQCIDRAHRIGQTRPVRSFILTVDQSIDHQMVRRCLEKLRVINDVVVSTSESKETYHVNEYNNPVAAAHAQIGHGYLALAAALSGMTPQADAVAPSTEVAAPAPAKPAKAKPAKEPAPAKAGMSAADLKLRTVAWMNDYPEAAGGAVKAREIVVATLGKFGAAKTDTLAPAAYDAYLAELDAAIKAAASPLNSPSDDI